jgi:hypothetical protein
MDYEQRAHVQRVVRPDLELFLDPLHLIPPPWMPPLSIQDAFILHEMVLLAAERDLMRTEAQYPLINVCWSHRLPLSGSEVWAMLEAHGCDPIARPVVIERFDFGVGLLVGTQGRPPVKKRRMPALSKGRYLTARKKADWQRLFGYGD